MRQLIICTIAILCFSCEKYKAQNHYAIAIELEEAEQYHQAIAELDTAINLYPEYTEAYINRAIDQSVLGNYPEAIHGISKAIEYEPQWIELYVVRAEYLRMLDRNQEALADLDRAMELKFPDYNQGGPTSILISPEKDDHGYRDAPLSYIYNERAGAYYAMDSLHLALEDINYSLENRFNLPNSFYVRSLIFYAYDDKNQACRDLKAAIQHGFKDSDERMVEYCKDWTDQGLIETFPEE